MEDNFLCHPRSIHALPQWRLIHIIPTIISRLHVMKANMFTLFAILLLSQAKRITVNVSQKTHASKAVPWQCFHLSHVYVHMAEGIIVSCVPTTCNDKSWNTRSYTVYIIFKIVHIARYYLWISSSALLVMFPVKIIILMIKGCNSTYVWCHQFQIVMHYKLHYYHGLSLWI